MIGSVETLTTERDQLVEDKDKAEAEMKKKLEVRKRHCLKMYYYGLNNNVCNFHVWMCFQTEKKLFISHDYLVTVPFSFISPIDSRR